MTGVAPYSTLYSTLCVPFNADMSMIQVAFERIRVPDVGQARAWVVLTDVDSRRAYDAFLLRGASSFSSSSP